MIFESRLSPVPAVQSRFQPKLPSVATQVRLRRNARTRRRVRRMQTQAPCEAN